MAENYIEYDYPNDVDDVEDGEDGSAALAHIGIKRRSGRYPWGSGDTPFQRSTSFKKYVDELKDNGLTEKQIADAISEMSGQRFSTADLRANVAISTEQIYMQNLGELKSLTDAGMSVNQAAKELGVNESTARGWLKKDQEVRENSVRATAEALRAEIEKTPYLDVGSGNELWMGVSPTRLGTAVAMLQDEGYNLYHLKIPQLGTGELTQFKVLTKEDVTWHEVFENSGQIRGPYQKSDDGGQTFMLPTYDPVSFDSKRLGIKYAEDGGAQMDGVIEVRRGAADLDLGGKNYAQVRVAVDGTHYLKGMAMYADDLPAGTDIRFNTNKTREEAPGKLDSLKPMKKDPDGGIDAYNPFGATVRPHVYKDKDGNVKTSPLNLVNEEGDWDNWSRSLSSQMLSKQSLGLAREQLGIAYTRRKTDYDEIMSLTNPVVKQKMLNDFAENADSAAVSLKAAPVPGQSSRVILPMNSMRPNEIYAPGYENGDRVALVRYPHGGVFEIPELTVNNRGIKARKFIGDAIDAVGIHHSVAEQLSGADFDGDTVLVLPNNDGRVKSRAPLAELKDFNPKEEYRGYEGMSRMTKKNTQTEMGKISNLITDMTIHKAPFDEIARAVKHSMVVIDAEKHGLDYKRSFKDNRIGALKDKYQKLPGSDSRGASTLISLASSEVRVPKFKYRTDPDTGKRIRVEVDSKPYVNKQGKTVEKVSKVSKMELTDDAFTLSSGQPMEDLYASHANGLKSLANSARKEALGIQTPSVSKTAKAVYNKEVKSLESKLAIARRNAPLERRAQAVGNALAKERIASNPNYDKDDIKKIKYQSLKVAREATGASKIRVDITNREWEAIQSGAVAPTTLRKILGHADMDQVRNYAKPRKRSTLTDGQLARIAAMKASGRSPTDIAESLGLPRSTVVDNMEKN